MYTGTFRESAGKYSLPNPLPKLELCTILLANSNFFYLKLKPAMLANSSARFDLFGAIWAGFNPSSACGQARARPDQTNHLRENKTDDGNGQFVASIWYKSPPTDGGNGQTNPSAESFAEQIPCNADAQRHPNRQPEPTRANQNPKWLRDRVEFLESLLHGLKRIHEVMLTNYL